uniref:Uncharacterized protein n=1 Tax=Anguilla anguilla TaxID=7936 RepID=A0A0E9V055_ANGAN
MQNNLGISTASRSV